jgi:MFS family permease
VSETMPMEAGQTASPWGPSHRLLTAGLIVVVLGAAFEVLAVAATLPATVRELGGLSLYGWAFSAFQLASLIGITVAGADADRRGPAAPFIMGVGLFVVGLLIAGLAPTMPILVVGRAVQGLGAGFLSSVSYTVIGQGYSEEARPQMLALLSSAWVVPGLIGPAIGGIVADTLGWRWIFLGLVPLMLGAGALTLPALARPSSGPLPLRPVALAAQLALGAGLLVAAISGVSTPLALALGVAGAALGAPALKALLPSGVLTARPGLPAAIACMFLLNMAFFGVDAFVPLALTALRGQSSAAAGVSLTAATIAWTSAAWLQSRLVRRGSRRALTRWGFVLVAAGIAATLLVFQPFVPVLLAPIAWSVAGLGMGFAFSTISLVVLDTAAADQAGTAASAMQLANFLAVAFGAGIGGALVGTGGEVSATGMLVQGVAMIGVAALGLVAVRGLPHGGPGAAN